MVLGIVKQAVRIKMNSEHESLFISEAEYIYGCVYCLKELGKPKEQVQMVKECETIESLREKIVPFFEGKMDDYKENPEMYRLFRLLVFSEVEGTVTEEIRQLMDEI